MKFQNEIKAFKLSANSFHTTNKEVEKMPTHSVNSKKYDHQLEPSLNACYLMTAALVSHFFGYECARAASMSLIASKEIGLGSEALTYTVAVGSPAGAIVLYLYARSIRLFGPRTTLRVSEIAVLLMMFVMCSFCSSLEGFSGRLMVILYYSFREIYVSLLSTQHWSFIATILGTRNSRFVVSFAGSVSVSSALGGCAVEALVKHWGVYGLLTTAFLATFLSTCFAELAYILALTQGNYGSLFVPKNNHNAVANKDVDSSNNNSNKKQPNIWIEFWYIMYRSPTLRLLYVEAIAHQLVTNTLNLMFHDALRNGIADNATRAVVVGRFFATVNIASCTLQIFILPSVLCAATLPDVLRAMPLLMLFTSVLSWLRPSLTSLMLSFGTMKVLEYSIMTAAGEMIYMPMSHDDRYLGKEVIRFFGHKLGKSGSSLLLSTASSRLQPSSATMSSWAGAATIIWGVATHILSYHLATRDTSPISTTSPAIVKTTPSKPVAEGVGNGLGADDDDTHEKSSTTTGESHDSVQLVGAEEDWSEPTSDSELDAVSMITPPQQLWYPSVSRSTDAHIPHTESPVATATFLSPSMRRRRVVGTSIEAAAVTRDNGVAQNSSSLDSDALDQPRTSRSRSLSGDRMSLMVRIGSVLVSLSQLGDNQFSSSKEVDRNTSETVEESGNCSR